MKAAIIMKHGSLNVVEIANLPVPETTENSVLVKVHAASLNHLDIWVRKGIPGSAPKLPHILGADGAGTIEKIGENVQEWKVGDEVIINPGISCGRCEYCNSGEHSLCAKFQILGENLKGTFAEYVVVPARNIYRKPQHLSWTEAAAYPLVFVTAWRMLVTRAKVSPGETILILGIGGGVSTAALQIAELFKCRIAVTSGNDNKLEKVKKSGVELTLNYYRDDIPKKIKEWTQGKGVNIVIDSIGGDGWVNSIKSLARGGRLVTCGSTMGATPPTDIQRIFWNQLSILGSTMGSCKDFEDMHKMILSKAIKPVIDTVYSLEKIAEAMKRMEDKQQFGKLVLKIFN